MKRSIRNSFLGIVGFLLAWAPAAGFDLTSKLSKANDKLGIPDPIVDQVGSLMYAIKLKSCNPCETAADKKFVETVWATLVNAVPQCDPYKTAKARKVARKTVKKAGKKKVVKAVKKKKTAKKAVRKKVKKVVRKANKKRSRR